MAFDVNRTMALIKGGLLDHQTTWKSYLDSNPSWQQTVQVLTGPLLVVSVVLSVTFSRMMGSFSAYAMQSGWFMSVVLGLLFAAIGILVTTFVFNFLAGVFKGTSNFPRAFAAVSLAAIPAWLANAVAPLIPYLGGLLSLAGGILSLVFLYKIIPLALAVPQEKRVVHFIASIVLMIVIQMVVGFALGLGGAGSAVYTSDYGQGNVAGGMASSGVVGELTRQSDLMEAAGADSYVPPADGEVSKEQVKRYISVMRKTRAMQSEYAEKLEKASADMQAKQDAGETPSLADLRNVFTGAGSMMSANNAEMEVVKTGGGNWAEHEWVKSQLRAARIQQGEGSAALEHNFKLYKKFEEELTDD